VVWQARWLLRCDRLVNRVTETGGDISDVRHNRQIEHKWKGRRLDTKVMSFGDTKSNRTSTSRLLVSQWTTGTLMTFQTPPPPKVRWTSKFSVYNDVIIFIHKGTCVYKFTFHYTVMRRVTTFRATTARIYERAKNFWKLYISWYVEIKCQLEAREILFIADLIACSTCFGHHYAHHQELESIIQRLLPVVFGAVVFNLKNKAPHTTGSNHCIILMSSWWWA